MANDYRNLRGSELQRADISAALAFAFAGRVIEWRGPSGSNADPSDQVPGR